VAPALTAAAITAAVVGWYALHCWVWPFKACGRCAGSGKRRSSSGKAWRVCKRCKGGGAKLRLGRKVTNFIRSRSREGTR
jgi:hypothetical protein